MFFIYFTLTHENYENTLKNVINYFKTLSEFSILHLFIFMYLKK